MNAKAMFMRAVNSTKQHSPAILTGIGMAGVVITTATAIRATPRALKLIEERKRELRTHELATKELIGTTWKCYIPTVIAGATTMMCIFGANKITAKRTTALAAAYTLSETALKDSNSLLKAYKEKVVENFGADAEHKIKESIEKDQVKNSINEVISEPEKLLFCDESVGRYFESSKHDIEKSIADLNALMMRYMSVSMNDWYDLLNIDHTSLGDTLGWDIQDGPLEVYYDTKLSPDYRPCMVIVFNRKPTDIR